MNIVHTFGKFEIIHRFGSNGQIKNFHRIKFQTRPDHYHSTVKHATSNHLKLMAFINNFQWNLIIQQFQTMEMHKKNQYFAFQQHGLLFCIQPKWPTQKHIIHFFDTFNGWRHFSGIWFKVIEWLSHLTTVIWNNFHLLLVAGNKDGRPIFILTEHCGFSCKIEQTTQICFGSLWANVSLM